MSAANVFRLWPDNKYMDHLTQTVRRILNSEHKEVTPWVNKIFACQKTINERMTQQQMAASEVRRALENNTNNLDPDQRRDLQQQSSQQAEVRKRFEMYRVVFHYLKTRIDVEELARRLNAKHAGSTRSEGDYMRGVCDNLEQKLDPLRQCRNELAEQGRLKYSYNEDVLLKELVENSREMIDETRNHLKQVRQQYGSR